MILTTLLTLALATPATQPAAAQRAVLPGDFGGELATAAGGPAVGERADKLRPVVLIDGPMPTTFDVAADGTIYAAFPRWRDPVNYTVVKIDPQTGDLSPFPDAETNQYLPGKPSEYDPAEHFVCVQAVHLDPDGRLWVLDTGAVNMGTVTPGGAKLWAYDPQSGKRLEAITFDVGPDQAIKPTTYLNDVRFDLTRGEEGYAFITDSNESAIVVVDLATGEAWRKLEGDDSTKPDKQVTLEVEGEPLMIRPPEGEPKPFLVASDGIAVDRERGLLYYTPLTGRAMYAVPLDDLIDRDADASNEVMQVAEMQSANDGIVADASGRIYTTDFEDNAIRRIKPGSGEAEVIFQDERLLWPDCVIVRDGTLYVTSNQLNRQPQFHGGDDLRERPFVIFAYPLDDVRRQN